MSAVVSGLTRIYRGSHLPSQFEVQVLIPQLQQAGSVNAAPRRRCLANNHLRISLSHCLLVHPCVNLQLRLPQHLLQRRSQ